MKTILTALAITVACSIAAEPQMPLAAQAEIDRMAAVVPQVRHSADVAAIIAAKATGKFSTDGKEPQFVRNKDISMGGKTRKAVAMDGVKVGEGGSRTLEEQRFLEMNGLVQTYVAPGAKPSRSKGVDVMALAGIRQPAATNDRKIYRNRVRYVAAAMQADISNLELFWSKEDMMAEIENTKADVAALQAEIARLRQAGQAHSAEISNLENQLRHAQGR